MLYYLDNVIVIYAVEGNLADQQRASQSPRREDMHRDFGPT